MNQKSSKPILRASALGAVSKIVDPLIKFSIEVGLSVGDIEILVRESAVRAVAHRQAIRSGRVNVSGIAAVTGLSRTEVARNLKKSVGKRKWADPSNQYINRVLRGWHEDPEFIDSAGRPLDLDLFGKTVSFESLVRRYGGGLPLRALLDELLNVDAAEVVNSQIVKVKTSVAIDRGLQPKVIESFGKRAAELIESMLNNLEGSAPPKFVATIEANNLSTELLGLVRKEVASRGGNFLSSLEGALFPESASSNKVQAERHVGRNRASITIFYFDDEQKSQASSRTTGNRRNFKRKPTTLGR